MKNWLVLILSIMVLGCASTPVQRMEANSLITDFEICFRLAFDSSYQQGEMKTELEAEARKRELDCSVHETELIAKRKKQLKAAAFLMALGNSLKQNAAQQKIQLDALNNTTFNNYSSVQQTGFLINEVTSGMGKICYYNVVGTTKALNVSAAQLCPISYKF